VRNGRRLPRRALAPLNARAQGSEKEDERVQIREEEKKTTDGWWKPNRSAERQRETAWR
jgi:hypothetical protein